MVSFPNAKINLGLYITAKRPDGYHDIDTIFYPIHSIRDALEIIPASASETDITFSSSGLPIPGNTEQNLCIKAYRLLKSKFPQLPAVQVHLHKQIPMGAGMGGGSADGAFMLQLLNDRFSLGLTQQTLSTLALELGSDCPFFLENKACRATGRGEQLQPVSLNLDAYQILLINPGIHVPTGWAFAQITPGPPQYPIEQILTMPVEAWQQVLFNDFEQAVIHAHPAIGHVKDALYKAGARYASMTGTGSTVYGIFPKGQKVQLSLPDHYLVF